MAKESLRQAQANKKDEFYTTREVIEDELHMDDLKEYIDYLADILKMDSPNLKHITVNEMAKIAHKDTLAAYDRSHNVIYIIDKEEYSIMDYYLISHEMRHAWQNIEDPEYYFDDYYEEFSDQEYNVSRAEIDANAFACIAIAIVFGKVTQRVYKKDETAQIKYNNRLNELKQIYDVEF